MKEQYQDFSDALEAFLSESLSSEIDLIELVSSYLHSSGGKRIRPKICYLVARSLGCTAFSQLVTASAIIELIHSATLMHDDVVDQSTLRRGVATVNKRWGAPAAILTGDFVYSRAFQLAISLDDITIAKLLADTSNLLAEGEVAQLVQLQEPNTSEAAYLDIIYKKTGALFSATCQSAALLAEAKASQRTAAALLGKNTGIAFQIIDDLLDYTGTSEGMGKPQGTDFYEGKITLPLIHLLSSVSEQQSQQIRQQLGSNDSQAFALVGQRIMENGSYDYCFNKAQILIEQAIENFIANTEPSQYRDQLTSTLERSVGRQS